MIKFFRRIRQRLLSENRLGKYMLYALGEIVLVVIGILIALQINNWNERQKDQAKEQAILEQLMSEYQSNLTQLDEKILMRNEAMVACNDILQQIDHPDMINEESLLSALITIARDPTFDPIQNDIIGSEKIRLIRNDSLVRMLSNWSSEVYQVQEIELDFKKYRTETIFSCYNRLGLTRNMNNNLWKDGYTPTEALDKTYNYKFTINPSKKELNLETVLQDVELEGIVSQIITYHQIANIQSTTLRERIIDMLSIIEGEIE